MIIHIEVIPISEMRYPTVGDYWYDEEGILQIRVADMGNEFYEKMVVVHELFEEATTKENGITEQVIMDFDLKFELERQEANLDEPGFDKNCPYLKEHTAATAVEMMMCSVTGTDFMKYDKTVNEL